ncbi:MAG: hypothetical protein WCE68_13105 [Anaerolineales bacterium]
MDSDLIPAVCPSCGGTLQVAPGTDLISCPYCGTEHIIRREVGGSVTLEAYARCPLCKRNDRSEKVSGILTGQTTRSESIIPEQQVYTDSQGHAHTKSVNVPVRSVQTSDLARRLTPPDRPAAAAKGGSAIFILIAGIILAILGICGLFVSITGLGSSSSPSQSSILAGSLICGAIPFIFAAVLLIYWFFSQKEEKEKAVQKQASAAAAAQQWQAAMARWEKLYYCARDDVVFIPGEGTSATLADMPGYLNAQPSNKQPGGVV